MLTQAMAMEIVEQTMIRLNRNINIMNEKGTIIASGNQNRINQVHSGALEVLRTGKPLIIQENDLQHWQGSLPGINLPIGFQNLIIGVIGITGDPLEIMEFGELVKMITEMMIQQSFIAEQFEWKQRLKEQVFEELLKEENNEESITQRLNLINVKLTPPFQVAVIDIGHTQLKKSDLLKISEDIFNEEHSLIGFFNVNRMFLLTSNLPESKLKQRLRTVLTKLNSKNIVSRIGIGSIAIDHSQVRHSFNESLQALMHGSMKQNLISYTEIETKALIAGLNERSKMQYLERVLGNISDKLIETLEQFFKHNQNIGECSKNMYIHRNSLIYRIKKIKDLTGYDPQVLSDAITLQLAIWIMQMNDSRN